MDDALGKAKLSANMLLQVHDELVFEVPDTPRIPALRKQLAPPELHVADDPAAGQHGAVP
jgi:hypothetical protein